MSNNSNRIAELQRKILISEHSIEIYKKDLTSFIDVFISKLDSINDVTANFVRARNPEFLDKNYLESIKELNYDDLQEVIKKLELMNSSILDEIEGNLS